MAPQSAGGPPKVIWLASPKTSATGQLYADTAWRNGRYAKISFTFSRTCWLREGFR